MFRSSLFVLLMTSLGACVAACDGDDPPSEPEPTDSGTDIPNLHEVPEDGTPGERACAELGTYCHAFDRGTGDRGDQCHDVGHQGDPEACLEIYDECMEFCQADDEDAGPDHDEDAGHEHEDEDGGQDAATGHDPEDAAAGEHGDEDAASGKCAELGQRCHDFDTPDAEMARECHDVGHEGDEAACAEIYDECLAVCPE